MSASKVQREKVMNVSAKALYRAITQFEHYPEFIKEVVSAKVQSGATKSKAKVTFELEVVKRFQYVLEFKMKPDEEVIWRLAESNFFKQNDGSWNLKSIAPKKTEVQYQLEVGFGFLVPGWVSRKLTEINLPQMFEAFEARAASLKE